MPLNIYLISHPITKLLSEGIINNHTNQIIKTNYYQKIGFLLTYETSRKLVKFRNIYIKKIDYIKNMTIIDKQQPIYIISNIQTTYQMLSEIPLILPEIKIINLDNHYKIQQEYIEHHLEKINQKNINIIIIQNILNNLSIANTIKDITKYTKIPIKNICIACIACYDNIVNELGNRYPQINIYTTKIIT